MKYFLDCEFHEDGRTIDLISIALVSEDGREYYAVSSEADYDRIWMGGVTLVERETTDWLKMHVMPYIDRDTAKPRAQIRDEIVQFLMPPHVEWRPGEYREFAEEYLAGEYKPQFWGYYADYDWVAFCQLFGRMIDLPRSFPKYCMDIKQLCNNVGNPQLPVQTQDEHHALADARWNKVAHDFCMEEAERRSHASKMEYMNFFTPDDVANGNALE